MKEYKVDVISVTFKTNKGFEEKFQNLLNERVAQGYQLHSFSMHLEVCTVIFEREASDSLK